MDVEAMRREFQVAAIAAAVCPASGDIVYDAVVGGTIITAYHWAGHQYLHQCVHNTDLLEQLGFGTRRDKP